MADHEPLRLVVSNSAADVEREKGERHRQRAEDEVAWALRQEARAEINREREKAFRKAKFKRGRPASPRKFTHTPA